MIETRYAYQGDHELIYDEPLAEQVHEAFAALVGGQDWSDEPWASVAMRRLLAERETIALIQRMADEAADWPVDVPVPPIPEVPDWLLGADE